MSDTLRDDFDPLTVTPGRGIAITGKLDEASCAEMAERFGFQQVHHVHYELNIKLISKQCWQVSGRIKAKLIQNCVATAVPVKDVIDAPLSERFVADITENDEIDVQDVSVEPLIDGYIPLRDMLFQFIAVTANPYPRKDGAPETQEFGPKIEKENPFSKLIQLKK